MNHRLNQRAHERLSCEIESTFRPLDTAGSVSETLIRDISEGGLRFRSNRFLPVHERLLMRFPVPGQRTLEVVAKPAWVRELPSLGQFEIGAQFLTLSESDRAALRSYIRSPRVVGAGF